MKGRSPGKSFSGTGVPGRKHADTVQPGKDAIGPVRNKPDTVGPSGNTGGPGGNQSDAVGPKGNTGDPVRTPCFKCDRQFRTLGAYYNHPCMGVEKNKCRSAFFIYNFCYKYGA